MKFKYLKVYLYKKNLWEKKYSQFSFNDSYYLIGPQLKTIKESRKFCGLKGGKLAIYNEKLANFVFKNNNKNCRLDKGVIFSSSDGGDNCYNVVLKINAKIVKKFQCRQNTKLHFVCQNVKFQQTATTTSRSISAVKTESKVNPTKVTNENSKVIQRSGEKSDGVVYNNNLLIILLIGICLLLMSLVTLMFFVSEKNIFYLTIKCYVTL